MTDQINPANVASSPNAAKDNQNPNNTAQSIDKQSIAQAAASPAAHTPATTGAGKQTDAARTVQRNASSEFITNPAPAVDPDAPVAEPKIDKNALPQGTIDEMNAGKKALERNRPVAERLEEARGDAPTSGRD